MAIEDYMNTPFILLKRSETKEAGRLKTSYTQDATTYTCAIFTPATQKTVVFNKQSYLVAKNLYCSPSVPISDGDVVIINSNEYDVTGITNTNESNHHLSITLITRVSWDGI